MNYRQNNKLLLRLVELQRDFPNEVSLKLSLVIIHNVLIEIMLQI